MKKTLALLVSATALCTVPASSRPDDMGDFDSFMSDALTDFNSFIDEANRDFINFMRNPWKKYQATEPQEQRTMPEPETQPLYTPATDPSGSQVTRGQDSAADHHYGKAQANQTGRTNS